MDEWQKRSEKYDKLQWTYKNELLLNILKKCEITSSSHVCDVGTGTGTLAQFISPYCKKVDAVDISEDMLKIARLKNNKRNICYHLMNAENLDFKSNTFNCIVSRMCFHHVDSPLNAIKECYRVLKSNGKIVICEAVPPPGSFNFYVRMFKLKEKRHVFIPDSLVHLLEQGGFEDIHFVFYNMPRVSIRNWLSNSGLSKQKQDTIFNIWLNSQRYVKEGHNLSVLDNDIFVDWSFLIISGLKK